MSFIQYVFSKAGMRELVKIILVNLLLIGLIWLFLWWYTDHGRQVAVPDVRTMSTEQAVEELASRGLGYLVVDSLYDEDAVPGSVVEQSPAPESKVKEGRQVYLTIYRIQPPMERISIEEGEFAQVAIIKLKNKGIRYDVRYVPNNNMVGSVVSVTHRGKKLRAGDEIRRGEMVVLTVGEATDQSVVVPQLMGKSYAEAMAVLDSLNLMGQAFFEPNATSAQDSTLFRVCRQDPEFRDDAAPVPPGRIIDFWLSKEPCGSDQNQW